jgi:hypothetical protein
MGDLHQLGHIPHELWLGRRVESDTDPRDSRQSVFNDDEEDLELVLMVGGSRRKTLSSACALVLQKPLLIFSAERGQ